MKKDSCCRIGMRKQNARAFFSMGWNGWLIGHIAERLDQDFRRYLLAMMPYRRRILAVFTVGLLSSITMVWVPYFSKLMLEQDVLSEQGRGYKAIFRVLWLGFAALLCLMLGHGLDWLRTRWEARLVCDSIRGIRVGLFRSLLYRQTVASDEGSSGSQSFRLNQDVEQVGQFACGGIVTPALHLVRIIAAFAVIFWIHSYLAFAIGVLVVPLIVLSGRWFRETSPLFVSIGNLKSCVEGRVTEVFRGLKSVISCSGQNFFFREFRAYQDQLHEREIRAKDLNAELSFLWTLVLPLAQVVSLILGVGIYQFGGQISMPEIVAVQLYLALLLNPIWQVVECWFQTQRHRVSICRVFRDWDPVATISVSPSDKLPKEGFERLELDDVSYRYSNRIVLRSISLTIARGTFNVIVGPSGAGKTTLLDIIFLLRSPESGQILLNRVPAAETGFAGYRSSIFFIPQESVLFEGSVWDNVSLGSTRLSREQLSVLAEKSGLADCLLTLDGGWNYRIGENGAGLSGGQKQAVGLLRGLASGAPLLILDESTSYLDALTERRVFSFLSGGRAKVTTIVVTHRKEYAEFADQIAVLIDGRIQSSGKHDQLLEWSSWYRRNFGLDLRRSDRDLPEAIMR